MKKISEILGTTSSSLVQAASGILILKLNLSHLDLNEIQIWVLLLATLPFYTLIEFGVTTVLPKKLTDLDFSYSEKYCYIRKYTNRAIILHALSIPLVGTIFWLLDSFNKVAYEDWRQLLLLAVTIAMRAYFNIAAGVVYSLGKNLAEKAVRGGLSAVQVLTLYTISMFSEYSLNNLLWLTFLTSLGAVVITVCITMKLCNVKIGIKKNIFEFDAISKEELSVLKTTIPAMFVINSLPFLISILLDARDNINYAFAQQIFGGLSILTMAPVIVYYKKLTVLFVCNINSAKNLLNRLVLLTATIAVVAQGVLAIEIGHVIDFVNGYGSVLDKRFIVFFMALMSFEWVQGVMTRGAMASGYYNFWRQTTASAFAIAILSVPLAYFFGLYGLVCAVFFAQLPTCHYYNIKIALERYGLGISSFFKFSFPYYIYLPVAMCYTLK